MIDRITVTQFFRFSIVGLLSNVVLYGVYLGLTGIGLDVKLAMTLLYIAGVFQTFIFNKRWSFLCHGPYYSTLARYFMSYALGYLINLLGLIVLVEHLGYPHQLIQGVMIFVLAIFLFLLQKFWVFRLEETRR